MDTARNLILLALLICPRSALADEAKPAADETIPVASSPADERAAADKQAAAAAAAPAIAIVGGRVLTMESSGELNGATVLIQDGKILAVGTDVAIPDGATKIDAAGMTVLPGLIDVRSSLWLAADSVSASASDGSLNAADAINLFANVWPEVARQGVTTVGLQPSGSLGGRAIALRVAPAETLADLLLKSDTAIQASLGLSGRTDTSRDRFAQYEALKKTFEAAKKYQEEWQAYEEAVRKAAEKKDETPANAETPAASGPPAASPATGPGTGSSGRFPPGGIRRGSDGGGGPGGGGPGSGRPGGSAEQAPQAAAQAAPAKPAEETKPALPKKPKKDELKELLVRVLNKELPLRLEAHRADDVAHAIRLADEFKLNLVLEGLSQSGRSWAAIQQQHPPLVVGPLVDFEAVPSYRGRDKDRWKPLSDFSGLMAIGTFSRDANGSRLLRFHAAAAVASGVTSERALQGITSSAAKVLGVDDVTGSIRVGKLADITVIAGDPLDPSARTALTMSRGVVTYRADVSRESRSGELTTVVELPDRLPEQYALVSERVLYPDGKLAPGAVLVRDGRITSVNAKKRTGKLTAFDLGSAVITPGLVVGHVTGSDTESTDALVSQVHAVDALNPESQLLQKLADGGFTAVAFAPDSRSVVAGQYGCVRIGSDHPVAQADGEPASPGSKFVLSAESRNASRFPAALAGQLELLTQYLSGKSLTSNVYVPSAVKTLLTADNERILAGLKDRSKVAMMEAGTRAEIDAAIALIDTHRLKAALLHPEDLQDSLNAIKQSGCGLIVRTFRSTDHDWYADDLSAAAGHQIPLAVSGTDADEIRRTLAVLVAAGVSSEAALRAVTSDAVAVVGLPGCGRLEAEAPADLVIWNGSPLNTAARPVHVIVDGQFWKAPR